MPTKENRSPEEQVAIKKYMSELGRKSARVNKKKGSEYFKWVRSHGVKKDTKEEENV